MGLLASHWKAYGRRLQRRVCEESDLGKYVGRFAVVSRIIQRETWRGKQARKNLGLLTVFCFVH